MIINSKDNPHIKRLKKIITQPKRTDDTMLIEGIHACQLLLQHRTQHGLNIHKAWVGEAALQNPEITSIIQQLTTIGVTTTTLHTTLFRDLSSLEQGVSLMIEVERPRIQSTPAIAPPTKQPTHAPNNYLLIDGVQDPGNMGSIIRSAAAAGIHEIWLNASCVNPYAPKVLRAGVGAHFGIKIIEQVPLLEALSQLKQHNIRILATSSHTTQTLYASDLAQPCAWIMGNEGAGVAQELLNAADTLVGIPMQLGESLNVAAATAVCLFEMKRQQLQRVL